MTPDELTLWRYRAERAERQLEETRARLSATLHRGLGFLSERDEARVEVARLNALLEEVRAERIER